MSEPSQQTVVVGKRTSKPYVPYGIKRYRWNCPTFKQYYNITQEKESPCKQGCTEGLNLKYKNELKLQLLVVLFLTKITLGKENTLATWYIWPPVVWGLCTHPRIEQSGSRPGQGHCVLFLDKTLYSYIQFLLRTVPLCSQVYKWVPANLMPGGNPVMD